jgi:hypothetical protein
MKVGDLVQTKKGGFGVGPKTRIGIIINVREAHPLECRGNMTRIITISCPRFMTKEWYDWQLEVINECHLQHDNSINFNTLGEA